METICIDIIFGLLYMFRKKFTTKQGWKPVWSCFRDSYLLFAQFWAGVSFSKVRLTISLIIGKSAEDRINSFNLCLFSEKPRLHILVKDVTRWDVNKVGTMWLAKIICSHKTQGDFFQQKGTSYPANIHAMDLLIFFSSRKTGTCVIAFTITFHFEGLPRHFVWEKCTGIWAKCNKNVFKRCWVLHFLSSSVLVVVSVSVFSFLWFSFVLFSVIFSNVVFVGLASTAGG